MKGPSCVQQQVQLNDKNVKKLLDLIFIYLIGLFMNNLLTEIQSSGVNIGAVVGGTIGGLVLITLILVIVIVCIKRYLTFCSIN